jgi:hypothetical protein
MIFYSITRWPIEALRADERTMVAGMTAAQVISVGVVIAGLALWYGLWRIGSDHTAAARPSLFDRRDVPHVAQEQASSPERASALPLPAAQSARPNG